LEEEGWEIIIHYLPVSLLDATTTIMTAEYVAVAKKVSVIVLAANISTVEPNKSTRSDIVTKFFSVLGEYVIGVRSGIESKESYLIRPQWLVRVLGHGEIRLRCSRGRTTRTRER
jgi:hypothetical protein